MTPGNKDESVGVVAVASRANANQTIVGPAVYADAAHAKDALGLRLGDAFNEAMEAWVRF